MKKFQGIIFDFNGVLLWDTPWHEAVWQQIIAQLRGKPLTSLELEQHMAGRTNKDILSYVLGRSISDVEAQTLGEEKEAAYRRYALAQGAQLALSPGATDLLDYLVAHAIPHTIATNSGLSNTRFYFEQLSLDRWFDFDQVVYDNGGLPGKPDPTIYLLAAAKVNLAPSACVVIEDSTVGLAAANRAGIGKIVALGPSDRHDELRRISGVAAVIASLQEFDRITLS